MIIQGISPSNQQKNNSSGIPELNLLKSDAHDLNPIGLAQNLPKLTVILIPSQTDTN